MKTWFPKTKQSRGVALLIMILIVAVAALFFMTYFVLTQQEYGTVVRAQEWNNSLTVAEAGVEEGLALVNKYAYLSTSLTNWSSTSSADGWTNLSTTTSGTTTYQVYYKKLFLPNSSGYYAVYVTNIITSGSYGAPTIYSVGTVTNGLGASISREVLVKTTAVSIAGSGGIIAWNGIDQTGGSAICDSWDSSTPLHSIWQTNYLYRNNYFNAGINYGIWATNLSYVSNSYPSRTAGVYIFTDSNTLTMSGTVAGFVETGAGGTESISGACIGDLAWCFGASGQDPNGNASSGIETGHNLSNANFNFNSYTLPNPSNSFQSTWLSIPQQTTKGTVITVGGIWWYTNGVWGLRGGTKYTNTSGNGFTIPANGNVTYPYVITNMLQNTNSVYYSASANQFNNQNLFVDAQYVVLYLPNGFSLGGGDYFTINTNADMQIWSEGNIAVNGGGVLNNMGDYTHALSMFDVAGHPISVSLTGSGAATGYYYLPSSSLTISGGGGGSSDFVGAIVCNNLTLSGGQRVHFDQSLGNSLPPDQFIPSSWSEISPPQ